MIEIRGHSAYNQPATAGVRTLALLLDLLICLALFSLLDLTPVPDFKLTVAFLAAATLLLLIQLACWKTTLGGLVWKLVLLDADRRPIRFPRKGAWIAQRQSLQGSSRASAIFLTLLLGVASLAVLKHRVLDHPLLLAASTRELPAFAITSSPGQADWGIAPFYYSIGAWPKVFNGKPVLFSLPYEKGPPTHFLGHIVARWEMPETKLTLEGPKTPDADRFIENEMGITRACLTSPWLSPPGGTLNCLKLREKALGRHIREISQISPKSWKVEWFEVLNPALPETERPRGIFLRGSNDRQTQERFIVINGKGAYQAFILDRPSGEPGELARMMFEQAVRSQRVSTDLAAGRSWVDRKLSTLKLDDLRSLKPSHDFVARVAEIHSLLLAKISVEPKTYEAYYHLGGTALMLARHGKEQGNSDWTAVARPLIQSALKYAKDVAPLDRRTTELEGIWQDVKKF
jgi:hypothetical protein